MDGPINFGERDKWWGCLVEGFNINPNYQQNFGKNIIENYLKITDLRFYLNNLHSQEK